MEYQKQIQMRREKGKQIAQTGEVRLHGDTWLVPSQSSNRHYQVVLGLGSSKCTCLDFTEHGMKCKHIFSVEYTITKQKNPDGTTTITEIKKVTYSQEWAKYDAGQISEKERFMELLNDLLKEVPESPNPIGRPQISNHDMFFACALKVYTQFSLRRFMSDLRIAKDKGCIQSTPSFASVGHFMQRQDIERVITQLIYMASMPLRNVESQFAMDSSGFRTTRFTEYCKEKHKIIKYHRWLKAHIVVGVKTNVITSVEIDNEYSADCPKFIPLAQQTFVNGFKIKEMSADKAYLDNKNFDYADNLDFTAFIPFREGSSSRGRDRSQIWRTMYHYFMYNRDEFMEHYHKRSNVETTFFMIKSKFNDTLKGKTIQAQANELLFKLLCHNIVVINNEINFMHLP